MLHVIYPCGLICRPFNTLSGELSQILADPVSCLLWIFFPEIHSYLLLLMCSILMFMSIFFIPLVHLCLSMAKSDVAYRAGYLDKWRKEGRGCIKEWRFFFLCGQKEALWWQTSCHDYLPEVPGVRSLRLSHHSLWAMFTPSLALLPTSWSPPCSLWPWARFALHFWELYLAPECSETYLITC